MPDHTAFSGERLVASGSPAEVARAAWPLARAGEPVLIFDETARPVEIDFRGALEDVLARLEPPPAPARSPGRPKLGVTAREVTLLPRHWTWLAGQPGGASVALRKLVEEAMRSPAAERRAAQEAAYRFISAMAGDRPGFEEAARALFAGDANAFGAHSKEWPRDIRDYAGRLAAGAF